ncbi:MAG: 16S rRNA (guanine(966)-N(2))-methyltransferase RsmD [Spongiibacteraceae bacterium]|nr:16S rRNA (guanine(966)-N(2))-methyltransferase RsmD [Spongiibacteraceae bacterium]
MTKKPQASTHLKPLGQLRIIAGQWRGRKLTFTNIEGLRPTPDRVRETLFNWLNTTVCDAHCLDLFAGSGALALEALSRGAQHVDLIENAPSAVKQLREQMRLLKTNKGRIWQDQAEHWLNHFESGQHKPYSIVFIDPPFRTGLVDKCIKLIENKQVLAPQAWVYLEMGSNESLPVLPKHWTIHREKTAGQVCYRLIAT